MASDAPVPLRNAHTKNTGRQKHVGTPKADLNAGSARPWREKKNRCAERPGQKWTFRPGGNAAACDVGKPQPVRNDGQMFKENSGTEFFPRSVGSRLVRQLHRSILRMHILDGRRFDVGDYFADACDSLGDE